jgi:small-conductance mechanosensitive channel
MEQFASALTLLLEAWSRRTLGPWADRTLVGSIDGAEISSALAILLLTGVIHAVLALVVQRYCRSAPPVAAGGPLKPDVFFALGRPAYLLTWLGGLYLATTPLLSALPRSAGIEVARGVGAALFDLGIFVVVTWVFMRFTRVLDAHLARWAARTDSKLDDLLVSIIGRSLRVLAPVAAIIFALPILHLPAEYADVLSKGTSTMLIVAIAVVLLQAVRVCQRVVLSQFDMSMVDNLRARQVSTQVHVIGKVLDVVVTLVAVACVLMLFPQVKHVGASLLASAGILGVIAGIAAQKTTANLLAGVQIAMAQPIREDDVVIVEGEWGRVEDITLTYVVVRIWDERRLVVPLSYFIDKPFQNWTRGSTALVGSIFVWVDYSFPVEAGRAVLKEIIESSALWDRRVWNVQVADANEKAIQLRILASAADATATWDLRCEIREKFIAYIQAHHPESLPRLRTDLARDAGDGPEQRMRVDPGLIASSGLPDGKRAATAS